MCPLHEESEEKLSIWIEKKKTPFYSLFKFLFQDMENFPFLKYAIKNLYNENKGLTR